jgi:beta-glucanase (GH16 family)
MDAWEEAHADYTLAEGDLSDDFHIYGMEWTKDFIKTTIDGQEVLNYQFPEGGQFAAGGWDESIDNPWQYETDKSAPFNQDYYLIFNVAVGGTNDYWPEGQCGKPWSNTDQHSVNAFYNAKGAWMNTWNYPATHDSAMKIDYVRVYQDDGTGKEEVLLQ